MGAHDTIRFTHASASGRWWILVDLSGRSLSWRDADAARPLPQSETERLCALARAVRPEHTDLQPTHVTYAQDESLEVVVDDERVVIDATNGEICAGPPGVLVEALHTLVRVQRDGA